jgi:glucose-6-phosphate isomerase
MATTFNGSETFQSAFKSALETLQQQQVAQRVWDRDASLWKKEADVQETIKNRLGWLFVAHLMQEKHSKITDFVDEVRQQGYTTAILLGMGGSSLCPEVLRSTFPTAPDYLKLFVLDSTDVDTIHTLEQKIDLLKTIFIVASKSGDTLETLAHYKYFYHKLSQLKGEQAGEHFIVITDPGTSLEILTREQHFHSLFTNPADIGGRYSALSFFGLVPGALIGIDIEKLLSRAQEMMWACRAEVVDGDNPGLWLGAALTTLYKQGRDKVTFLVSPEIRTFGYWVEQLIAESTGKEGHGLVPVTGERPGVPAVYGNDRLFVYLRLKDGINEDLDDSIKSLQDAGQPVISIELNDRYDLGQEFFRWEFATAIIGYFLKINPFDEPNVKESKNNTKRILAQYLNDGHLTEPQPLATEANLHIYGKELGSDPDLTQYLHLFLNQVHAGDYIAIMAYVEDAPASHAALQAFRIKLRDKYQVATTLGIGPRFLHSTGQLHKGGPNNGVFIQITGDLQQDALIPDERYTFGILKDTQALGDLFALDSHQRRFIRIHILGNVVQGLQAIELALNFMY